MIWSVEREVANDVAFNGSTGVTGRDQQEKKVDRNRSPEEKT